MEEVIVICHGHSGETHVLPAVYMLPRGSRLA